jgi:hypothetical protein
MARDEKRRQKALARQAAKRKAHRKEASRTAGGRSSVPSLRASASWPVHEVLISRGWEQPAQLVQILVARRSPLGQIACGLFLVDLGCLGVKNAFGRLFDSEADYRRELRDELEESRPHVRGDLNLAAKIIREAIAYARDLGFEPHRDYRPASVVLSGADPDACPAKIPLGGDDGKPFYIAGPYDHARAIVDKLIRRLGPDGFHYIIPIEVDDLDF